MYTNIESLRGTTKTNTMLVTHYTSIIFLKYFFKVKKLNILVFECQYSEVNNRNRHCFTNEKPKPPS